ncbi:uncharacterized protein LOC5516977 [Nematostella vectensis]|uniref:uncharacterized protein LOC5516977 n=1 Tax=Nematostella vectensis TaxID=45351 RepID=UPI00207725F1|nr:uncharacterized protein LOC5516977 [Nematostella vectensis]
MRSFLVVLIVVFTVLCGCTVGGAIFDSDFDICAHEVIKADTGNVSLKISSFESGSLDCRRVIQVNNGRIKLTLHKFNTEETDVFDVYDGSSTSKKISQRKQDKQPVSYESAGNTILLSFKADSSKNSAREVYASFSAIPFQDSCNCRSVPKGTLHCRESSSERSCSVKCSNGTAIVGESSNAYSCDLLSGKWNNDIHSHHLSCQPFIMPSGMWGRLNITYDSNVCEFLNKSFITKQVRDALNVSDSSGGCFKGDGSCVMYSNYVVHCHKEENRDSRFGVTVILQDYLTNSPSKAVAALNATYYRLSLNDLGDKLRISRGNQSFPITGIAMDHPVPTCEYGWILIKHPVTLDYPICSTCPQGHIYNSEARGCQKCPEGQSAPAGANVSSCSASDDKVPMVPLHVSCDNTCMEGKELDSKSGHCQWCPENTYQNSSDTLNPKCTLCPDGKKTPFTGAKSRKDCYTPCNKGNFFSVATFKCEPCPLGTYMEKDNHMITGCNSCIGKKVTSATGTLSSKDCVIPCKAGYYYSVEVGNCTACKKGTYQENANQKNCTSCPAGKTTLSQASESSKSCIQICSKGTFLDKDNEYACKPCPKGTYMDLEGHVVETCKKCSDKKSTVNPGAKSSSSCEYTCTPGQYFDTLKANCMTCPEGTYQNEVGKVNCTSCPPGLATLTTGSTNKEDCRKICGKGEFFNMDKSSCDHCPLGTYQDLEKHTNTSCVSCPSKMSTKSGATNKSACISFCDSLPCEGGECKEAGNRFVCMCPSGLTGKRCETVAEVEKMEKVKMSVRFTGMQWKDKMSQKDSMEYKQTRSKIESAINNVVTKEVKAVKVTNLKKGSVVAEFDLYMDKSNSSLVPAKTLQSAVIQGTIDGLPVDSESLRLLDVSCRQALGMESGRIADDQITASSFAKENAPNRGRLHNAKGWSAEESNPSQYLQLRLHRAVNITGLVTQGASGGYVTLFTISYSANGASWTPYNKNFTANNDTETEVGSNIQPPINDVKYIRVLPISWVSKIGMRIEFYGCASDPVLRPADLPTPPITAKPPGGPDTTTDPNMGASGKKKESEYSWGKYLGIAFGVLMVLGITIAAVFWCRSSRKKAEREKSPLVLTRMQDANYKVIEKNADEYDEEDVV